MKLYACRSSAVSGPLVLMRATYTCMQWVFVDARLPAVTVALQELQVPMKLTDAEVRQLLVEFPTGGALHSLDDVTARARC